MLPQHLASHHGEHRPVERAGIRERISSKNTQVGEATRSEHPTIVQSERAGGLTRGAEDGFRGTHADVPDRQVQDEPEVVEPGSWNSGIRDHDEPQASVANVPEAGDPVFQLLQRGRLQIVPKTTHGRMRSAMPSYDHLARPDASFHEPIHGGAVVLDLPAGVLVEAQVLDGAWSC